MKTKQDMIENSLCLIDVTKKILQTTDEFIQNIPSLNNKCEIMDFYETSRLAKIQLSIIFMVQKNLNEIEQELSVLLKSSR